MQDMPSPFQGARRRAMPFYIVCDVSESMWSDKWQAQWGGSMSPWQHMFQEMNELDEHLSDDADTRDIVHLSIIDFAENAWVKLPMIKCSDDHNLQTLSKGTWTNFKAAWELLEKVMVADVERLHKEDYEIWRPTIFFITDGNPGSDGHPQTREEWGEPYDRLADTFVGTNLQPRVIAIGIGGVNDEVLMQLHSKNPHGAAVRPREVGRTTALIKPIVTQIRNSIRFSSSRGSFSFEAPQGMVSICPLLKH